MGQIWELHFGEWLFWFVLVKVNIVEGWVDEVLAEEAGTFLDLRVEFEQNSYQ